MPLFMDFHNGMHGVTIEEVKKAHTADLEIQAKFGVTYRQFWVNCESGTVFCLVEGPDKESCERVHQLAHGNVACNLSEVESGFYELIMATGGQHGLTKEESGKPDSVYRTFVVTEIQVVATNGKIGDYALSKETKQILSEIKKHNGREICTKTNSLIGVFNKPYEAINCAIAIQHLFAECPSIFPKQSVATSQPLTTEHDEFFDKGLELAIRLCDLSQEGNINVSSLSNLLFKRLDDHAKEANYHIRTFSSKDENFLNKLFDNLNYHLSSQSYGVESLSQDMAMSRTQLYRKVQKLSTSSPNYLIRKIRLSNAYTLLNTSDVTIAEVALKNGFSNPSYFTKRFQEQYGYAPSMLQK
ncbi:MAG: DUF4242 domain-containing protein [Reichenbachiella sp.]